MKIVFMGTPAFAVPSFTALLNSRHEILATFCQPDKPAGRHLPLQKPPLACKTSETEVPLFQPRTLKKPEIKELLADLSPDAIVVVAYGKILPSSILEIPPKGCINLHPSLLPRYRGASPIQSAIASGDTVTGITTMLMDDGMDTGPILLQREWKITEEDTSETLHIKLAEAGASLILETVDAVEKGSLQPIPQDDSRTVMCQPLKREDGRIDWNRSARTIYNRFRAFIPWPGSFTHFRGKLFKIHWLVPMDVSYNDPPGSIISCSREGIRVATGEGCVVITHVQLEGKCRVTAQEFSRGMHIHDGERFEDHD